MVLCRSSLRRVLVKANANDWSDRMQLTDQLQCKWVVKSMQLHSREGMSLIRALGPASVRSVRGR